MDEMRIEDLREAAKEFAVMRPEAEALRKSLGGRPFLGTSVAAALRRRARDRGTLHTGRPGDVIEMSRDRKYQVASDGSFRRIGRAA